MSRAALRGVVLAALALAAALAAIWAGGCGRATGEFTEEFQGIMGTQGKLVAIVKSGDRRTAESAFAAAKAELSRVEALMSKYIVASDVSRFNAAPAGQDVKLAPEVLEVIRAALEASWQSDGAFDITCLPLLEVWKQAAKDGKLPTEADLAAAKRAVGWRNVLVRDGAARKLIDGLQIDVGGIAKGYGADLALAAMKRAGCRGAMVQIGGEIACFGPNHEGGPWRIAIRDPFDPKGEKSLGTVEVPGGAVSTSGNYFRYFEVAGRRYSHIVDPRSGQPADADPSVTVIAPAGIVSDAWSTALSVLGPAGLAKLPKGVEAMIVAGAAGAYKVHMTEGFRQYLVKDPAETTAAEPQRPQRPNALEENKKRGKQPKAPESSTSPSSCRPGGPAEDSRGHKPPEDASLPVQPRRGDREREKRLGTNEDIFRPFGALRQLSALPEAYASGYLLGPLRGPQEHPEADAAPFTLESKTFIRSL